MQAQTSSAWNTYFCTVATWKIKENLIDFQVYKESVYNDNKQDQEEISLR